MKSVGNIFIVTVVMWCLVPVFSDHMHVTTLINGNHMTCISSGNSPIYAIPPTEEEKDDSTLMSVDSVVDDWVSYNSYQLLQAPVIDLRWEDFATIQTNHFRFTSVRSVTFSTYTPIAFEIFLSENDENSRSIEVTTPTNKDQWIHYGIYARNNGVHVVQNGVILRIINRISPDKIVIKSQDITFWKIHDYSLKMSKKVTEDKPTIWKIPPSGRLGFMLYTSLCRNCYLRLIIETEKNKTEKIITSSVDNSSLAKLWEEHEIEIEPYKESVIKIYRGHESSVEFGYWAIEPRWPPKKESSLDFHQKSFKPVLPWGHVCSTLENQNLGDDIEILAETKFCSDPGKLGKDCNINCSSVLGKNFEYCENYQICENFNCLCSWGYHGPNCQESCDQAIWGLECQNKCGDNCTACDSKNGNCINEQLLSTQGAGIMVYCGIGIVAVVIILMTAVIKNQQVITKIKRQKEIFQEMSSQSTLIQSR